MKMFDAYIYRKLHKEAARVARRVKLPNPETLGKVCVLWQPGGEQSFQYLYDYFSHSQVIFRNICVYDKKAVIETGTSVITPKELNWLGLPRAGIADEFLKTEFDLLLNIAVKQNLVLDYLTALSRAHFKIGWSPEAQNFFDLNINIQGKPDSLYLAQQQIFYLGQLNKTTVT
jgi:hypothetical protein